MIQCSGQIGADAVSTSCPWMLSAPCSESVAELGGRGGGGGAACGEVRAPEAACAACSAAAASSCCLAIAACSASATCTCTNFDMSVLRNTRLMSGCAINRPCEP